ncbi:MAG: DUF6691 family protein [Pseudomonadota bacterium]
MKLILAYGIGLIFGLGIAISGMANPAKVINFFDIAGSWDPSLAFVMGAALVVTFAGYRMVFGSGAPLFDGTFHLPTKSSIDRRLVGGSALFGVGWGIAGFCPGGALPALGTLNTDVMVFMTALVVGVWLARWLDRARTVRRETLAGSNT